MPSVTKYPGTISQNTGTTIVSYTGLNNLKNANNTYAKTGLIGTKNQTKKNPPTIKCTNFGFNLPEGAEVTSIVVEYAHQKTGETNNTQLPSIGKNTIQIVGAGLGDYGVVEHAAPPKTLTAKTKTFNGKYTPPKSQILGPGTVQVPWVIDIVTGEVISYSTQKVSDFIIQTYNLPSVAKVNSTGFGVWIDYPPNTGKYKGYLQLKYVRITVNYKVTEYSLRVTRDDEDVITGIASAFYLSLSNLNLTKYSPTLKITVPSGTEVENYFGDGTLTGTGTTLTWNPGNQATTSELTLRLIFTEGNNKTVSVVEQLTNTSQSLTFNVLPTPTGYGDETEDIGEQTFYAEIGIEKTIPITIPEIWTTQTENVYIKTDEYVLHNGSYKKSITIPVSSFDEDYTYDLVISSFAIGTTIMNIGPESNPTTPVFTIKTIPHIAGPAISVITLTAEELDRLGHDITYTVSSFFKLNADISDIGNFEEYYRNFRLGVVNQEVTDTQLDTIYQACNNWSSVMTTFNNWEEKTVEFTFNEDYPVYVIITGDYILEDDFQLDWSEIAIIETDTNGEFSEKTIPEPILECIDSSGSADVTIPAYTSSNPLTIFDFGFEDDFGTNTDYAITGIEVLLDINTVSDLICNVSINGPGGKEGNESIIINPSASNYLIGGTYDLFGLKIGDMITMNNWEADISLANSSSEEVDAIINSIYFTVYFTKMEEQQKESIIVDGENLAWYNAFIENVNIPMGLETDTKYVTVAGTDVNEALIMSVRGKEIELEISVGGCDLTETTELISEIMKLLTNKRDELNRPIPKLVEFSFLPNDYFEYIKEDASDSNINVTDYDLKIKLNIPSGTSFAKDETVTGSTGVIDSITKINPIISIVPTADTVEIVEDNTEQTFNMGYTGWIGKYVTIDCAERKVFLQDEEDSEAEDISYCADMNNDWFVLDDAFNFRTTGGALQSVTWTNRR